MYLPVSIVNQVNNARAFISARFAMKICFWIISLLNSFFYVKYAVIIKYFVLMRYITLIRSMKMY